MVKETYSWDDEKCRLIYRYAVTGLETADTKLVKDLESMMDTIFNAAEEQIKKELYKRGLMTCNAYLERIDDMRVNGNYLVQDYIKELDAKYSGKEIAYVIVCQPTELPGLYYFAGFSNVGAPRYEYLKTEACRYSSFSDAKQVAESLMTSRLIVNYTVRLDTLK
jgi:hypothetical protein